MRECVMADGVALGGHPLDQLRMWRRALADHEKRRAYAFLRQRGENLRRRRWIRPVVEGQDDFVIFERQGLRKALGADPRIGLGIDRQNSRRAERIGAWALFGMGDDARGNQRGDSGLQHDQETFPANAAAPHDSDCIQASALAMPVSSYPYR